MNYLTDEDIYIYGAGEYAFWLTCYLITEKKKIKGYIVTYNNPAKDKYLNKPVYEFSDFIHSDTQLSRSHIIIAVSEKYMDEISGLLSKNGIDYDKISSENIEEIIDSYVKNYQAFTDLFSQYVGVNQSNISDIYSHMCKSEIRDMAKILMNPALCDYKITSDKYMEYPRYTKANIRCLDQTWIIPDFASFINQYGEIFVKGEYNFIPTRNDSINIIDFGANIGMSVRYFCERYPEAQIEAYEADPNIFTFLKENVRNYPQRCGKKIKLVNAAVWNSNTELEFYTEGADGGRVSGTNRKNNTVKVKAVSGSDVISRYAHIDMLKIDIEGAETKVLINITAQLNKVDNIFVEYHSIIGEEQTINTIMDILIHAGFRIYCESSVRGDHPFIDEQLCNGFDSQINIWGKRA